MNFSTDIKPVTYLKPRAADLLDQINETQRPVIITQNGEPRGVLQDPKSYENMCNAIGILKLLAAWEADIRDGKAMGPFGDAQPVGEGISELRIHCGPGYRIYVTQRGTRLVLLLAGGGKATQAGDIEQAKRIAKDWKE